MVKGWWLGECGPLDTGLLDYSHGHPSAPLILERCNQAVSVHVKPTSVEGLTHSEIPRINQSEFRPLAGFWASPVFLNDDHLSAGTPCHSTTQSSSMSSKGRGIKGMMVARWPLKSEVKRGASFIIISLMVMRTLCGFFFIAQMATGLHSRGNSEFR